MYFSEAKESPEAMERRLKNAMNRDCANVRVLETLERVDRTPAERVSFLERKVAFMPSIIEGHRRVRELRAQHQAGALTDEQLRAAVMELFSAFPAMLEFTFPPGYAVGTIAQETAIARCELSRARWELKIFERTGRIPGRLIRR